MTSKEITARLLLLASGALVGAYDFDKSVLSSAVEVVFVLMLTPLLGCVVFEVHVIIDTLVICEVAFIYDFVILPLLLKSWSLGLFLKRMKEGVCFGFRGLMPAFQRRSRGSTRSGLSIEGFILDLVFELLKLEVRLDDRFFSVHGEVVLTEDTVP